jgi:hypothetical protein
MTDWSNDYTYDKKKYTGREMHLQGKFRGFGIERMNGPTKQGPYYYFLGDPHVSGDYLASASEYYMSLLKSIAKKWGDAGTPPTGDVNAPGGRSANYRGTALWAGPGD